MKPKQQNMNTPNMGGSRNNRQNSQQQNTANFSANQSSYQNKQRSASYQGANRRNTKIGYNNMVSGGGSNYNNSNYGNASSMGNYGSNNSNVGGNYGNNVGYNQNSQQQSLTNFSQQPQSTAHSTGNVYDSQDYNGMSNNSYNFSNTQSFQGNSGNNSQNYSSNMGSYGTYDTSGNAVSNTYGSNASNTYGNSTGLTGSYDTVSANTGYGHSTVGSSSMGSSSMGSSMNSSMNSYGYKSDTNVMNTNTQGMGSAWGSTPQTNAITGGHTTSDMYQQQSLGGYGQGGTTTAMFGAQTATSYQQQGHQNTYSMNSYQPGQNKMQSNSYYGS